MSWAYWGGPAGGGGGCGLYCCDASEARRLSAAILWAPLQSDASVAFTSAATQETPPPPPPLPEVVPGDPWPQFKADPSPPPCPPPTLDPPGGEPLDADTWTPPENCNIVLVSPTVYFHIIYRCRTFERVWVHFSLFSKAMVTVDASFNKTTVKRHFL